MPVVRYPGGNFVSCYDWKDGVGPRELRPSRPDYAWRSIEMNQFGTDEFMSWCDLLGTQPMLAVNLGTGSTASAAELLEYCNLPGGSYWADKRREHGHAEPYAVKLWCLGNEMDGPWQAGHVPAEVYAQRADQAGAMMKGLDPSIETIVCGSSHRYMPTYMQWDRTVLEYCWDHVDYISAHRYSHNRGGDTAWFLAEGLEIDRILDDYAGLLAYVRGIKKSNKQVFLSFDEWNVWYKDRTENGRWSRAPHLIEEVYNLEDALVCAQYLTSFLRHADTVKIACIAQIVNVIAPILTRRNGLLVQAIYHPFRMMSQWARGEALRPVVSAPTYRAGERGEAPVLDCAASYDPATGSAAVFQVNRNQREDLDVSIGVADRRIAGIAGVEELGGGDVKAANSWDQPYAVTPGKGEAVLGEDGTVRVRVPSPGLAVLRIDVGRA
jgi:alpha-N-arabinofuranosidase